MSFICEQCSDAVVKPTEKELKDFVEPDNRLLCDECKRVKKEIEND